MMLPRAGGRLKAMRRMRRQAWGLAFAVLVLTAAGCSSGGSSPSVPVQLDAGPDAAAAVAPVQQRLSRSDMLGE